VPKPTLTSIQEDSRFRVLHTLQDNPNITQRELASRLGVSLGTTNFLLRALLEKGAIKIRNFRCSDRKLSYSYILTPQGIKEKVALTARFLERKQKEFDALKAEIESVRQGLEQGLRELSNEKKFWSVGFETGHATKSIQGDQNP
jgi:EPS-associated MarR family transcriptional regulator